MFHDFGAGRFKISKYSSDRLGLGMGDPRRCPLERFKITNKSQRPADGPKAVILTKGLR